jgi:hypothetical protein
MTPRGLFFDEDVARRVAERLTAGGFAAEVGRARFAGEDDDEDQPWSVTSDAPDAVLEVLVEAHDGWLDDDEPAPSEAEPLPLPTEPVRFKRPPH